MKLSYATLLLPFLLTGCFVPQNRQNHYPHPHPHKTPDYSQHDVHSQMDYSSQLTAELEQQERLTAQEERHLQNLQRRQEAELREQNIQLQEERVAEQGLRRQEQKLRFLQAEEQRTI